jgi:Zn-dependent protease with chaperone function
MVPLAAFPQQRQPLRQVEVKVQKTSLSRDQEIQLGKEAAAEVERTMEIVNNQEIESWLNQIGQQLARTPQANAYPYYFKLVNEDSVNAFALPGGPMYVHTGLVRAAENENELTGVLAHEMSHVALRHGAAQLSKQQTWGTFFGAIGAVAGIALGGEGGECGVWCQAVQMGAGLGANSVLLKFSRAYERDADLNGARMMASAGYNPMGLAAFFERLESKKGTSSEPRGLATWMSSHPPTGNRVQSVSQDIQFYPKRSYSASTGKFPQIKNLMATLPRPKPKPAALLQAKEGGARRSGIPSSFKDYQAAGFAIAYPGSWQAGQAQQGGSVYLIPQGGAAKQRTGGVELLLGAMIDYYVPSKGAADLDAATSEFVLALAKGDTNLRAGRSDRTRIGGQPALITRLTTRTSSGQEQTVQLYTVAREAGLWYVALAAPAPSFAEYEPVFRQMADTVQFPTQ